MGSGGTTPRFPRASRRRPQTPRPYDTYPLCVGLGSLSIGLPAIVQSEEATVDAR